MATQKNLSKPLNITLWVLQVLLGAMFLMAGITKATQPIAQLDAMLPWADEVPEALVRFIGLSEILGGLGLVLPMLLKVRPVLTPLAAAGLALIMVLAAIFHFSRGEMSGIGVNIVMMLLLALIAWSRYTSLPAAANS
ncbi:MAG: DoxX family protein [Bacteroidia bacterium]|nr:DoxX family protein [Bacteroidia bacterium]